MDKVDIMQEQMNNVKVRGENSWKCPKKEMLEIKNTSVAEMKNVFFGGFISRQGMAEESISKFENYDNMNLKMENNKSLKKKKSTKQNMQKQWDT